MPIKSAITGGKYEEFHPVFRVLHHRRHRIQGKALVAVAVVVDVFFVVIVVVVVVVVVIVIIVAIFVLIVGIFVMKICNKSLKSYIYKPEKIFS